MIDNASAASAAPRDPGATWTPQYRKWRHGGWYVTNVHYPDGAVGCVSNNYLDHEWRIVDDLSQTRFATRAAAARAERVLAEYQTRQARDEIAEV